MKARIQAEIVKRLVKFANTPLLARVETNFNASDIEALVSALADAQRERDEANKHFNISAADMNELCDGLNRVLDKRGGYQESGGDTYAANFERLLSELESQLSGATQRAERAEAVVEKLPRTADGVYVGPNTPVYNINGRRYITDNLFVCERDSNFGEDESHIDNSDPRVGDADRLRIDLCYSTREAALAARETGGEASEPTCGVCGCRVVRDGDRCDDCSKTT